MTGKTNKVRHGYLRCCALWVPARLLMRGLCALQMFVGEHVCTLLLGYFNNLQPAQVTAFVTGLFSLSKDPVAYKTHIRDFLIELRVRAAAVCVCVAALLLGRASGSLTSACSDTGVQGW